MTERKSFPPGCESALSLFVTNGNGEFHQVLLVLKNCYDQPLAKIVASIMENMVEDGLRLVTDEEFARHALHMMKEKQEHDAATMLQDRGADPDVLKKWFEGYMGKPGGDA